MKSDKAAVLNNLETLNPVDSERLITAVELILSNGHIYRADDVREEKGVIYARNSHDAAKWLITTTDEIIGYEAIIDDGEVKRRGIGFDISTVFGILEKRR